MNIFRFRWCIFLLILGRKDCVLRGLLIQLRIVNVSVNGGQRHLLEFVGNIINVIRNGEAVCLMCW